MNNTNIPIPSQSFHTYNMPTSPIERFIFIMLDHNKLFIITLFHPLLLENDSSVIQSPSETLRLNCIVHY